MENSKLPSNLSSTAYDLSDLKKTTEETEALELLEFWKDYEAALEEKRKQTARLLEGMIFDVIYNSVLPRYLWSSHLIPIIERVANSL